MRSRAAHYARVGSRSTLRPGDGGAAAASRPAAARRKRRRRKRRRRGGGDDGGGAIHASHRRRRRSLGTRSRVASRVSRVCVAKSRVPPTFGVPPSRRLRNTCRHVISWHPSHYPRASHTQTNAVEGTSSSSGDRSSGDTSVPAVFPETTSPSPSVDTASEAEDLDDDNEPVLSEAAQKANREVDAYVKTSSEQSTELCCSVVSLDIGVLLGFSRLDVA